MRIYGNRYRDTCKDCVTVDGGCGGGVGAGYCLFLLFIIIIIICYGIRLYTKTVIVYCATRYIILYSGTLRCINRHLGNPFLKISFATKNLLE